MLPFVESLVRQIMLTTVLDIAITAIFIYWLFSLIRGTRAVTLVIGMSVLLAVYALAQFLQLRLFTQLLQAGAVVGLFALVVVFQPELNGAVVSVPMVVHVEPPAGARSKTTCWTSVDGSDAVAFSVMEPATGVPGSVSETDGSSVSTLAVAVAAADTLPTLSAIVNVYR